jgi:hypothetical protein
MCLRRTDHWSRGVLQSVMCPLSVIEKLLHGKLWPRMRSKVLGGRGTPIQKQHVVKEEDTGIDSYGV